MTKVGICNHWKVGIKEGIFCVARLRIAQQERSLVTDMIDQYFYFLSGIVQHKQAQSHSYAVGVIR